MDLAKQEMGTIRQRSEPAILLRLCLCLTTAVMLACGYEDNGDDNDDDEVATSELVNDVPLVECDPLLQDCGDGRNCTLIGNSFQCVTIIENGVEGEKCLEETECGLGLACLQALMLPACEDGVAKCCTPLCALDEEDYICPASDEGTNCVPALYGDVPEAYENFGVCLLRPSM